ncbi:MAG: hypothetical protein JWN01_770 [Patescibacteria group bacterium]|nr:hypothetical protein [Patescibacteria group bacterium]
MAPETTTSFPLTPAATNLVAGLKVADSQAPATGQMFHVSGLGQSFYFAYEQLRNVAEYREHHLLLRGAIERYLARNTRLDRIAPAAAELITELTQAGYLKNDSQPLATLTRIDELLAQYATMYQTLHALKRLSHAATAKWFWQIASVQVENLVAPNPRNTAAMRFAYEHYLGAVDRGAAGQAQSGDQRYQTALYCAVQRAIFKSDLATTRSHCVATTLPDLMHQPVEHFIELNQLIDELYQAPVTNRLFRLVSRYGAPMRIITRLTLASDSLGTILNNRDETLSRIRALCAQQYIEVQQGLKGRIIKSIMFIFITKTLIGVSLEVPYDLTVHGAIAWTPLLLNITFPVLYMTTIGARIATPGRQNTEVIASYADRIFYNTGTPVTYKPKRRVSSKTLNRTFNIVYTIGFLGSLALLIWILHSLHFNIVNGAIFFVFFSAVSFLGFRLRQSAHELQMLDEHHSLVQTLIDFLSTPFVRVGHWISDKYAKANIVTTLLDLAIEMPLKTSLRLVRHWIGFLRDKQDEL